MYKHFCIIIFLLFISCSDELGNKSATSANENDNAENTNFFFNTYNGLIAEEPCNEKLQGASAHISENNADYVCVFDDAKGIWNWRTLSNPINEPEQNENQSSSIISSSSLQISSSSSYTALYNYSSTTTVVKSSSSSKIEIVSSSSVKANWAYLNPSISYGEIEIGSLKYKTVTIGMQTWMAENMSDLGRCRQYKSKKFNVQGCLYSWEDAMSICPKGWHLPDSVGFTELSKNVLDAQQLASRIWENKYEASTGDTMVFRGSDNFGFSTLPIGYTTEKSSVTEWTLAGEGSFALFWTSKKVRSSNSENMRKAFGIHIGMNFQSLSETCGLAVRCIKDEEW